MSTTLQKNILDDTTSDDYLVNHFANKKFKRRLEEEGISDFIKNDIIGGLAISLFGPALLEHLKNFIQTRGRSHVIGIEWSEKIYKSWINHKSAVSSELNIFPQNLHFLKGDIFKLIPDRSFKDLVSPLGQISDIDLDLMGTAGLEVPKVIKLLNWFSLNLYLLSDKFCITYTCTSRDKDKLTIPSIRSLDYAINHFLGANLIKVGHRSYREAKGAPMYSIVYVLEKTKNKKLLIGNKEIIIPPLDGGYPRKKRGLHVSLEAIAA